MYYYIARNVGGKIERASCAFLFVNNESKIGQLVRSTMFSFIAEPGECVNLVLYIADNNKTIIKCINFTFTGNTEIQNINETDYKIQFQCENDVYFCPTLFICEI